MMPRHASEGKFFGEVFPVRRSDITGKVSPKVIKQIEAGLEFFLLEIFFLDQEQIIISTFC